MHCSIPELAGGKQVRGPLLDSVNADIEAGGDDSALVDAAVQVHDDLAGAVVIDNLELVNVACMGESQ